MKKIVILLLIMGLLLISSKQASAYVRTRGYLKKSGTYVMPHFKSNSNSFKWDNWSSKGNTNPFTGKKGYKNW